MQVSRITSIACSFFTIVFRTPIEYAELRITAHSNEHGTLVTVRRPTSVPEDDARYLHDFLIGLFVSAIRVEAAGLGCVGTSVSPSLRHVLKTVALDGESCDLVTCEYLAGIVRVRVFRGSGGVQEHYDGETRQFGVVD